MRTILGSALGLLLVFGQHLWAFPSYVGYSNAPGSRGSCTRSCHGSSGGTITVSGFPATYTPGQSYTITVRHSGGVVISNFNSSVRIGTGSGIAGTITAGLNTSTYFHALESVGVHLATNGQDSGRFTWTAPSPGVGTVRLYLAGFQGATSSGVYTEITQVSNQATVVDVGCTRILAPTGTVDSTQSVTPACSTYNYGSTASTYRVRMRVGSFYNDTARVTNHSGGTRVYVTFPAASNWPRGQFAVICSTELSGDAVPANDRRIDSVTVRVRDVACTRLLAPVGTVDTGTTTTPACSVYNAGTVAETYTVRMLVGTGYTQTATVTAHAPGTRLYVTFPAWTANVPRGNHAVSCSTSLTGDMVAANNRRIDSVTVRVRDVACTRLLAPVGTVDTGTTATPACSVYNAGTAVETYTVRMRVGTGYSQTATVTAHAPGTRLYVTFPAWAANVPRGNHAVSCSTSLTGDIVPANDKRIDSVFVRVRDVGISRVVGPVDTVPDAIWLHPTCRVKNYGNVSASPIPVQFQIGAYLGRDTVAMLAPGESADAVMAESLLSSPGTWLDDARTTMTGDANPANNTRLDTFWVLGTLTHDVAAVAVLSPTGTFDTSSVQVPGATVRNNGSGPEDFTAFFTAINLSTGLPVYRDSVPVTGLAPGATDTLAFASTRFTVPASYQARCSVYLATDQDRTNDVATGAFTVVTGTQDVGVTAVVSPTGFVPSGTTVTPRATWHNYATLPAGFRAYFFLVNPGGTRVYRESTDVAGLAAGRDTTLAFAGFNVGSVVGAWTSRCSTYAAGDTAPANDVRASGFTVGDRPPWPNGWVEVAPKPTSPSGRPVKDGGWLAFDGATGFIYGATGNKTSDLHRYDAVANTWTVRSGVPMGTEGKPPSKGAAACADGAGVIYVTKGNSTSGFYRYTTRGDSWYQLPDVPLGTTGKKVKGGTDLAYVPAETDSGAAGAYLLKGTQNEFWRYDPASGQWMSLRDAPAEKWGKGSWLVFDGSHTIYAHQAKDHGFFAYNTVTGMWGTARPGMPLVGRSGKSKKSKDGGSATWSSGCIYALKGGGTQEFWRYKPEGDSWRELDTVPLLGTTGKKKKVKGGGDITTFAPGAFFAFKGGGTQEFWRYVTPVALGAPTADRSGATAVALDARRPAIAVSPNPLRSGLIALRMDGSAARSSSGRVEVDVHDATGRRVFHSSLVTREPSFTMDLGSLPSGVYVVRLSAGHVAVTQRLVLQR